MAESAARTEIGLSSLLGAEKSSKPDELKEVPISKLHIPSEYPIKGLSDKDKFFCALQTKTHGIDEPLLVIPHADGYEVIDGMRRLQGAIANDFSSLQVVVKHGIDRETAIYRMCDGLARERPELLRSEKAHAYSEMLKIVNRQGQRTDLITSSQDGTKLPRSDLEVAKSLGISRTQLHRFVSYLKLIPPILEQVDLKSISTEGADQLVQLSEEQQTWVAYVMEKDEIAPSTEQATELKKLAQEKNLTEELVDKVMNSYVEPVADKLTLKGSFLKRYPYFSDKTPKQIENIIDQALTEYFKLHSLSNQVNDRSKPQPDHGEIAR